MLQIKILEEAPLREGTSELKPVLRAGMSLKDRGNSMFKSWDGEELEFSSNEKVADVTKTGALKCQSGCGRRQKGRTRAGFISVWLGWLG